jgi:hypothetical protein
VSAGRLLRNDDDDKPRGRNKTKESAYARKDARPTAIGLTLGRLPPESLLGRPGDFSALSISSALRTWLPIACRTPQLRELPKNPY